MLSPDTIIQNRYRLIYVVDDRPGGLLYRARDEQTGRAVLLSALPLTDDEASRELELLARQIMTIQHDVLQPLLSHFPHDQYYCLIAEEPDGQDLERTLRSRGGPLPEADVLGQLRRLLDGLDHLQQQRPPLFLGTPLPGDIWIGEQEGTWRLLPFPLARMISQTPTPY